MNRIINIILPTLFYLTVSNTYGQQNNRSSFLPKSIGDGINTSYSEINPVLSPDGKTLYFNRIDHPKNIFGKHDSQDVWYSELKEDKTWGEAVHLDNFVNSVRYNAILSVSNDGKNFLISGVYTQNKKWYKAGVSIVSKVGDEWSIPKQVKIPATNRLSEGRSMNAYMSYDGNYLLLSMTKRYDGTKLKLYISEFKDGYFGKPINLGKTINEGCLSQEAPFLSPNNETLYFSSKRKDGKGGFDVYTSKRMNATWKEWTKPVLLSDTINTPGYESYYKENLKATFALFASTTNSVGGSDIFKVKLKEEFPYIVLSGKILNKSTGLPMIGKKDYYVSINGLKSDSIKINFDSATYKARLPFGKKYVFKPVIKNYSSITDSIDATNMKEYVEIKKNLYVESIPYALIKGKFIDRATGFSLPPAAQPKLVINGLVYDSAKIDLSTASYSVRLPYGKDYTINLQAFKYIPVNDTLNLSKISEYTEINKPLYADKEKVVVAPSKAVITGRVFDKKTGKLIPPSVPFTVVVDGIPEISSSINAASSEYTIEVDPGMDYTLGGKAEGYYAVYENVSLKKEKGAIKVIKDLVLAPIVIGQAIRMNNIFFISGKAQLTPASFPELNKLVKFLSENPTIKVEIAGHTDNVGKPAKNLILSRWRARSCEVYLESKGVNPDQVSFNGYGSTKPVAPNKTPWGKSQNRRVEMVIKSVK